VATPVPDIAGFADAQRRLHVGFAEPVTFFFDPEVTFPTGTPLDPETGEPYDPAIRPTASGTVSREVPCEVAFKAINRAGVTGNEQDSAVGVMASTHVMLICAIEAASAASGAREFETRGDRFLITSQKPDGVGGLQRYLTYGRLK
jgi:hypothetical protein